MAKLAVIKTTKNEDNVEDYLNKMGDDQKRADSITILQLMEKVIGEKPKMWGTSMIGFGEKRYRSEASGREVDWFKIGFAPRKANLSIHLCGNVQSHEALLKKLGKHKTGSGCLYINSLADIDTKTLELIIIAALKTK